LHCCLVLRNPPRFSFCLVAARAYLAADKACFRRNLLLALPVKNNANRQQKHHRGQRRRPDQTPREDRRLRLLRRRCLHRPPRRAFLRSARIARLASLACQRPNPSARGSRNAIGNPPTGSRHHRPAFRQVKRKAQSGTAGMQRRIAKMLQPTGRQFQLDLHQSGVSSAPWKF
jgi:hypothetical protein